MTMKQELEKIELLLDQAHTHVADLVDQLDTEFDGLDEQESEAGGAISDKRDELQAIADAIENCMSDVGGMIIAEDQTKP